MTGVLAHLRAEARRRWTVWFGVVLLVGVVGGLVLGAAADARRTHTAYDRLVADTEAWDVLVNPDEGAESVIDPAQVAALPEVAELGRLDGVAASLVHEGEPTLGTGPMALTAADERVLVDFARPGVRDGELFDTTDQTQVMVDDVVAEHYGLRHAIQAMAPEEAFEFKTEASVADAVGRGTMPHTIALVLFAAVVGAAGLVVAGQAVSRQLHPLRSDRPVLPVARAGIGPGRAERLATSLSSPIATSGVRAALADRTGGRPGAALAGLSLAVAGLAATVTFGANIDRLVSTASEFGWSWDALVGLPSDEWEVATSDEIISGFDESPEITGWSLLTLDQTTIDGERIPSVGIDSGRGDVGLEILDGRAPTSDDEVALGGRTMDLLGVGIGDVVRAQGDARGHRLEVVGQALFPGVGTYSGADRTELGKGVLLTGSAISELGEGFGFQSLIVDAESAAALDIALDRALADHQAVVEEIEEVEVFREPPRPADVVSLDRVRSTPLVIASVLALLGGVAFAVVLVSGVRGRRREIAVLKTFGFRSRDVAGTVAWQATATAVVAGVTGMALGTVLGRTAWSVLAEVLGVAGDASVPIVLVPLFVGVVVAANLLAVVPGLVAGRTRPATMLRAE